MMLTGVPPALSHISANCEPALYKTLLTISTHESGGKLASGLRSPLCAHRFFTKLKRCGPRGSLASSAHLSCLGIPSANIDHDTVIRSFRSEEHKSELQSLMRISYAVFCLNKKQTNIRRHRHT